jgi:hypothetical protein
MFRRVPAAGDEVACCPTATQGIVVVGGLESRWIFPNMSRSAHPLVRRTVWIAPSMPTTCIPAALCETLVFFLSNIATSQTGL